ncbi:MAG: hypothetical protein J0H68_02615 [Sphingobacteriia bacterium]|nr:hypothetical protein [Sphingobacteriia bacterium]
MKTQNYQFKFQVTTPKINKTYIFNFELSNETNDVALEINGLNNQKDLVDFVKKYTGNKVSKKLSDSDKFKTAKKIVFRHFTNDRIENFDKLFENFTNSDQISNNDKKIFKNKYKERCISKLVTSLREAFMAASTLDDVIVSLKSGNENLHSNASESNSTFYEAKSQQESTVNLGIKLVKINEIFIKYNEKDSKFEYEPSSLTEEMYFFKQVFEYLLIQENEDASKFKGKNAQEKVNYYFTNNHRKQNISYSNALKAKCKDLSEASKVKYFEDIFKGLLDSFEPVGISWSTGLTLFIKNLKNLIDDIENVEYFFEDKNNYKKLKQKILDDIEGAIDQTRMQYRYTDLQKYHFPKIKVSLKHKLITFFKAYSGLALLINFMIIGLFKDKYFKFLERFLSSKTITKLIGLKFFSIFCLMAFDPNHKNDRNSFKSITDQIMKLVLETNRLLITVFPESDKIELPINLTAISNTTYPIKDGIYANNNYPEKAKNKYTHIELSNFTENLVKISVMPLVLFYYNYTVRLYNLHLMTCALLSLHMFINTLYSYANAEIMGYIKDKDDKYIHLTEIGVKENKYLRTLNHLIDTISPFNPIRYVTNWGISTGVCYSYTSEKHRDSIKVHSNNGIIYTKDTWKNLISERNQEKSRNF